MKLKSNFEMNDKQFSKYSMPRSLHKAEVFLFETISDIN